MTKQDQPNQKPAFNIYPIGKVIRQGEKTMIVLDKQYAKGLLGLDKQKHLIVVYWFDKNDTPEKRAILQVHPRGNKDNPLTGVFGTHSPVRPNLIAISECKILSIKDNIIEIDKIDAFDNTPVIDIKGDFFRYYKPEK
ncbi:MAG: tRNA (N6-threonylcarbamoyladenosine(37)-N6)-methyltransferase TrmO [Phycisphaerae bacterium]|nr:tRNA (N6-threonylcarbamoyladenosine(37)-N6)-methyltransferase TrmO [Phycisphaerae bacterium]